MCRKRAKDHNKLDRAQCNGEPPKVESNRLPSLGMLIAFGFCKKRQQVDYATSP